MRKKEIIPLILIVSICMISIGLYMNAEEKEANTAINEISEFNIKNMAASASMILTDENISEVEENPLFTEVEMEITPASVKLTPIEIYDSMTIAEREAALRAGTLHMEYSNLYTYSGNRLSVSKGAQYYNGHRETYYSEKVLPGTSLNIPGRHVAADGTIRDGNGFICVAADPGYMGRGSVLITSLGPAKVYDTGCAYGTIDIYVSW